VYNQKRRHSALDYRSPVRFEEEVALNTIDHGCSPEEIEPDPSEIKELDRLVEETRKYGLPWEDLNAELGL